MFGNTEYSVNAYGEMICDRVRMSAYAEALKQVIGLDSVVLDLGAGTGIFSLLACRLGASKVYAIEPSDAIRLGEEAARRNGFAQIEFIQRMSMVADLPQRADVMVSDLRGVTPLLQHHIPSIIDARTRLLAPGGVQIPQQDDLWFTIVESEANYKSIQAPWQENTLGLDLSAGSKFIANNLCRSRNNRDVRPLTRACKWASLDYTTVESADLESTELLPVTGSGTTHGIFLWFDTVLTGDIGFSTHPSWLDSVYGNAFLPFEHPVEVARGDLIRLSLAARLVRGTYVWTWETEFLTAGEPKQVKESFRQSTFYGCPISLQKLRKRASDHFPTLNDEGVCQVGILALMNGEKNLEQISQNVVEKFPDQFASFEEAFQTVSELSLKYSR